MKIIHLITGLGVGGAENVVYNLSKGQITAGHKVEVISLSARTEMLPLFLEGGIPVHAMGIQKSLSALLSGLDKSAQLIKSLSPDLIHAHMAHACLLATFLKWRMPHIKLVFTAHNIIIGNIMTTRLIQLTRKWRDADIIFSSSQQSNFNTSERIHVIPNGVSTLHSVTTVSAPMLGDDFRFIVVGRLEAVKNHSFLIGIAAQLKDHYSFKIDIFGEGPLRNNLAEQISKNGLEDIVRLRGLSMNIEAELTNYHAFLMPSLWEGMPITILEAGAAGLPIVTSSVGSIPDILDQTNSYVCRLEDFKDRMTVLMCDFDDAVRKAQRFKRHVVDEYNIQKVVAKHLELYRSLMF